jgi:methionine-rich copper-binding protein CopC
MQNGTHRSYRAAFAALALVAALLARPAVAHDVFQDSLPVAGDVLSASPPALTLRFIEPVAPTQARLRTAAGINLPLPDIKSRTFVDTIVVPLTEPLLPGDYVIEWLVWTQDQHPSNGKIPFTIRHP